MTGSPSQSRHESLHFYRLFHNYLYNVGKPNDESQERGRRMLKNLIHRGHMSLPSRSFYYYLMSVQGTRHIELDKHQGEREEVEVYDLGFWMLVRKIIVYYHSLCTMSRREAQKVVLGEMTKKEKNQGFFQQMNDWQVSSRMIVCGEISLSPVLGLAVFYYITNVRPPRCLVLPYPRVEAILVQPKLLRKQLPPPPPLRRSLRR